MVPHFLQLVFKKLLFFAKWLCTDSGRSFVYMIYKSGPNMGPWGTPTPISKGSDKDPSTYTCWVLREKLSLTCFTDYVRTKNKVKTNRRTNKVTVSLLELKGVTAKKSNFYFGSQKSNFGLLP